MKKKALSLALALVMCLSLLPVATLAADSDFTIENGALTKYNGPGGDVTIPNSVTSIRSYAFGYRGLTSVTIPESVTSIEHGAFLGCEGLISIQVDTSNQNYTSVDGVVFTKNLKTLVAYPEGKRGVYAIPSGVICIGDSAFAGCVSLTDVIIPNSVASIGNRAFHSCTNLTSLTVPSSVTSVGDDAFFRCENLASVTIPSSVTRVEVGMFAHCYSLTNVIIPSSVTSIGCGAFAWCTGLTSVTIPPSVTSIETDAFVSCTSLTNVTIPSSIIDIGYEVFSGCKNLTSITIPSSVTSIEEKMFLNCTNLTSATIPSSITSIETAAFAGCSHLANVYFGGSEAQWNAIRIENGNGYLSQANIHYNSIAANAQPEQPADTKTANPTNDKLEVNGAAANPTVYKIGGSNYFKIRDVAALLSGTEKQFAVGYSGGRVTVTSGQPYEATGKELKGAPDSAKEAVSSNDAVVIDGVESSLTVYKIGGSNYFKLRDLGEALDFYVGWEAGRGVYIETDKPYK